MPLTVALHVIDSCDLTLVRTNLTFYTPIKHALTSPKLPCFGRHPTPRYRLYIEFWSQFVLLLPYLLAYSTPKKGLSTHVIANQAWPTS